jgi:hypothetical protein
LRDVLTGGDDQSMPEGIPQPALDHVVQSLADV